MTDQSKQAPELIEKILALLDLQLAEQLRFVVTQGILVRKQLVEIELKLGRLHQRLGKSEATLEQFFGPSTDSENALPPYPTLIEEVRRLRDAIAAMNPAPPDVPPPEIPPTAGPPAPPPTITHGVASGGTPPTTTARTDTFAAVPIDGRDRLRFRMLAAHARGGETALQQEKDRIMQEQGLNLIQVTALFSHCQGKYRPRFVQRVIARIAPEDRLPRIRKIAELYRVDENTAIAWARGHEPMPDPSPAPHAVGSVH